MNKLVDRKRLFFFAYVIRKRRCQNLRPTDSWKYCSILSHNWCTIKTVKKKKCFASVWKKNEEEKNCARKSLPIRAHIHTHTNGNLMKTIFCLFQFSSFEPIVSIYNWRTNKRKMSSFFSSSSRINFFIWFLFFCFSLLSVISVSKVRHSIYKEKKWENENHQCYGERKNIAWKARSYLGIYFIYFSLPLFFFSFTSKEE